MGIVRCLRGLGSGDEYAADTIMNLSPLDGRPVEIVIDIERLRHERPDASWYHPERRDMWRFGALLPLDIDDPADRGHIVSLGEGCTPLLDYSVLPLAAKAGIRLEIKEEGMAFPGFGANPTRSFKDRGMAMVVSMARKLGIDKLSVPTQGNAGDSLTEYGLAAGLDVAVAMPDDTPMPIMGKVAAYAANYESIQLALVQGTIREAAALAREQFVAKGYFSAATFQEPGWRIDGKKTMGLEIAEPRKGSGVWRLPEVIIYPTGGGTGILGMWKAFDELQALGLIGPERPRIIAVQSAVTPPLVKAFQENAADTIAVDAGRTIAAGLNVPGGVGHFRVLEILYKSGGAALAVSDEAMALELQRAYHTQGWWLSPEGAACIAALEQLLDGNLVREGDHVVAFNTGSFEKYLPSVRHLLLPQSAEASFDADM